MNLYTYPDGANANRCPGPLASGIGMVSRRKFLQSAGHGFGAMALAHILASSPTTSRADSSSRIEPVPQSHFPARAKRCIFLFMVGGPSQMDLFDPKPALDRLDGKRLPESFGQISSQFLENDPICLGSSRRWGRYGQCGWICPTLFPTCINTRIQSRWYVLAR